MLFSIAVFVFFKFAMAVKALCLIKHQAYQWNMCQLLH